MQPVDIRQRMCPTGTISKQLQICKSGCPLSESQHTHAAVFVLKVGQEQFKQTQNEGWFPMKQTSETEPLHLSPGAKSSAYSLQPT